jgi:hypothetical protein
MGGYKSLLVFRLAVTIYDFTVLFCNRFINKKSRTFDQMVQAARSGKQNIVEASKELSAASGILLRQRGLPIWEKDDPKVLRIRAFRESIETPTNLTKKRVVFGKTSSRNGKNLSRNRRNFLTTPLSAWLRREELGCQCRILAGDDRDYCLAK